jgi:adenylyltransferase/sulfurtransferase
MPGVLVIGAGGLGCGAAFGLAAAGVRRIGVLDDDLVDESNLHRQVLHADGAIGTPKVDSLAATLRARFPDVAVVPRRERLTSDNALAQLAGWDVVLDGSDNLTTKFLANDAALLAGVPLVHAAAVGTMGQLLTVPAGGRPCYRCLFEELPPPGSDVGASCNEAGVLGPVPGLLGALQATEAVRLLRGDRPAFIGRLIRYDARPLSMRTVTFRPNPQCAACSPSRTLVALDPSAYPASSEECIP